MLFTIHTNTVEVTNVLRSDILEGRGMLFAVQFGKRVGGQYWVTYPLIWDQTRQYAGDERDDAWVLLKSSSKHFDGEWNCAQLFPFLVLKIVPSCLLYTLTGSLCCCFSVNPHSHIQGDYLHIPPNNLWSFERAFSSHWLFHWCKGDTLTYVPNTMHWESGKNISTRSVPFLSIQEAPKT